MTTVTINFVITSIPVVVICLSLFVILVIEADKAEHEVLKEFEEKNFNIVD